MQFNAALISWFQLGSYLYSFWLHIAYATYWTNNVLFGARSRIKTDDVVYYVEKRKEQKLLYCHCVYFYPFFLFENPKYAISRRNSRIVTTNQVNGVAVCIGEWHYKAKLSG